MSILIKVVSAQLTRDTEFFSNMDPYCILRLGSQSQRTKTKDEAGKKPVWNESFRFSAADNNLKVVVMDEDNVADDLIGEGQVNLTRFRGSSAEQEQIVQLYYNGKAVGKVLLRISGGTGQQPGNNFNQGNNWGNTQPNNGWGGQQQQNNQWGQPQQNNGWGAQNNGGWGNQNGSSWGNQSTGWNQQPGQFGNNQGGNQWGGQGNMNQQPPPNFNQFNPILQNIFQGSNQWGQPGNQGPQPPNNQWGSNQPPNSQWGQNPQAPNSNQGWGNQQNINPPVQPNNEIKYPDLEYKPPINNPQQGPYAANQNNNNMDVPFQLIGGMQGLFTKQNNNQGGNPYQT